MKEEIKFLYMKIEKVSGFNFKKIGNTINSLLIESNNISKTIEFIKANKIKSIELNSQWGYKYKNIDFIKDVATEVEDVTIVDDSINLLQLSTLKNLKKNFIGGENKSHIDFNWFKKLEYCNVSWHNGLENLNECPKLSELVLRKYLHTDNNFKLISELNNLIKLSFIQAKFSDLEFLRFFQKLKGFEIYYIKDLKSISGLEYLSKTLDKLIIENCKKIESYDSIKKLIHLTYLGLNDSSDIESLEVIKKLKYLKHLSFMGTKVIDGDLTNCIGIEYVGFDDKKHYSHQWKDIMKK